MNEYSSVHFNQNMENHNVPRLFPNPHVFQVNENIPSAPEQIKTFSDSINDPLNFQVTDNEASQNIDENRKTCSCKGDCTKSSGCSCAKNDRNCTNLCHKRLENKNCTRCV